MSELVLVLMSTYNGERYLREQIDSILAQEDVNMRLLVRDDGSTDSTLNILEEYQAKRKLTYYQGENLGPQLSFMHLLRNAPKADYYAFSDQDDIWMGDKLSSAIGKLKGHKAALYFSQPQITDENLHVRPSTPIKPLLTFGESLIYKFASGCTMVFNHDLREIISDKIPKDMPIHDIWIYLIAMAFDAHVVFDPIPHILYRQHGDNAIGTGHGFSHRWKERLTHILFQPGIRSGIANLLRECYGKNMPAHNSRLLDLFVEGKRSLSKRITILRDKDFRCGDKTTQRLFWISLTLNKY